MAPKQQPFPGEDRPFREFLVLRPSDELSRLYLLAAGVSRDFAPLTQFLRDRVERSADAAARLVLELASLPSAYWLEAQPEFVPRLVVGLGFNDRAEVARFREAFSRRGEQGRDIVAVGCDLSIELSDYFCPVGLDQVGFGRRSHADRLVRSNVHKAGNARVNVVVVDRGVDQGSIGANYEGGWAHPSGSPQPGTASRGHGAMTARNVLGVAGTARIWDLPLMPERITNLKTFLSDAWVAYSVALVDIALNRDRLQYSGSWVFVNPWALFDRKGDPDGNYTNNPLHPFNVLVSFANRLGHDVVFSAGNCGQFCPDGRCGSNDTGPGQSILGANSHRKVLTVGAVRIDEMWLGYSSQGPAQPGFATWPNQKPDLCAPANFCEDDDAQAINAGTSAACAFASGVVARLRTQPQWAAGQVSPEDLRQALRTTAHPLGTPVPNGQTGFGTIDAQSAYEKLSIVFPLVS